MNAFGRYFALHFKSSLIRLAVMVLFSSIFCFYFGVTHYRSGNGNNDFYSINLGSLGVIMIILVYIVAAAEFDPFKNRRNLDLWMSSPLSRTSLITVNILNGALHLTITLIIAGLICVIKMMAYNGDGAVFLPGQAFLFMIIILPQVLALYMFNGLIFLIGNCRLDGIIFMLMYMMLPSIANGVALVVREWCSPRGIRNYDDVIRSGSSVITRFSEVYSYKCNPNSYSGDSYTKSFFMKIAINGNDILWYSIWLFTGIASLILAIVYFRKLRPEKVGGPSTNFFGYTFLLPATGYSMIIIIRGASWIVMALVLMALFLGYVIFRKGFRFKIPDIVCMAVALLMALAFKIPL